MARHEDGRADRRGAARVGQGAALACALLGSAYVVAQLCEWAGLLGSAGGPYARSTPLGLVLLLTPSLLLGPAFVILAAALHMLAPPVRAVFSLAALAFATIYATLTGLVYYVQLGFVGPRIAAGETADIARLLFVPYRSFLFAVDLLGYAFMCAAMLLFAFAMPPGPGARGPRALLFANGLLVPFLIFQMAAPGLIAVASLWGIAFPAAMLALARSLREPGARTAA